MDIRMLPGGLPEPHELFGREHLIACIWEELAGTNVYLVAPRRFGKSGVMRHMLLRPRSGWLPVHVDVEDIHDPEHFASSLIAGLLAHASLRALMLRVRGLPKALLDAIQDRVEEIKGGAEGAEIGIRLKDAVTDDWARLSGRLITEMEKANETVVFLIDELPECVDNIAKKHRQDQAKAFLLWFRSLRLKQKDTLRRFRFVLGGSTGIDIVLRKLDAADKLNECVRIPVEPLSAAAADALLDALLTKFDVRLTREARNRFFELVSPPVPYFIHLFFSQLYLEESLRGKEISVAQVEDVYQRRILGPTCRSYFEPYRQRLKTRYGASAARAADAILTHLSESPTGKASETILYDAYRRARRRGASEVQFREIMADLECDWYVVLDPTTNEYYFFLSVMRDWWRRFYRSLMRKRG